MMPPATPLLLVAALAFVGVQAVAAEHARPKNVLLIVADDLNTMLGCYGDPLAKTPHLDRLAARGVRFDRAYCAFPLCGPSRNSFLTGLHPNATGILANAQVFRQTIPQHPSLPELFRRHGGTAIRVGKLYHYNVPASIGTAGHDDPASWEAAFNPAGVDHLEEEPHIFSLKPGQFGATLSWYASPRPDEEHTDGLVAARATRVLEESAAEGSIVWLGDQDSISQWMLGGSQRYPRRYGRYPTVPEEMYCALGIVARVPPYLKRTGSAVRLGGVGVEGAAGSADASPGRSPLRKRAKPAGIA